MFSINAHVQCGGVVGDAWSAMKPFGTSYAGDVQRQGHKIESSEQLQQKSRTWTMLKVANLAAICWNVSALNSALASSLITMTTGEVGTLVCRVLQAFLQQIEHDRVSDADRVS